MDLRHAEVSLCPQASFLCVNSEVHMQGAARKITAPTCPICLYGLVRTRKKLLLCCVYSLHVTYFTDTDNKTSEMLV